ncbi:C25 family cysteine peptidase [Bacteroidales bacterium OttesenSCG-928-K03]|nr:C25 family cysteine peptidase [Odoribacter sp. OttesenSCG-928-L07]MDL2239113.1 C25 family cysteine peptidase [Bacteroidales bacterium OttesenSCG-928-L14]MDL2240026.1 C25 family cysteine peptidase [Bacteroidales bacterium OttesenSCG-928-K22]MDL2242262.1 C25 family cysteine peptidase [Bacteroidales bacterium OttesenSCG-928-K03]
MKKLSTFFVLSKRFLPVIVFTIILQSGFSLTAQNAVDGGKNWNSINVGEKTPQTKLISSSDDKIVVTVDINGFYASTVETPKGESSIISLPKMVSMLEEGNPDLPQFAIPVVISDNANMTVHVKDAQYIDYEGFEIAPSKGNFSRQIDPESVPYTYSKIYETNAFYPYEQATLNEPYILRDYRGQNIMITPVAYNPVTKTLRVYTHLTIEMIKVGTGGANQFVRMNAEIKSNREVQDLYSRHFINFNQAQGRYTPIEEVGNMLIICYGDYMEAAQPLVDWKKTTGRPTEIVNVADCGTTADAIKAYVTEYYNTNGLTYLLLIGDHQHIPAKSMSGGYSDAFFSYITGNDSYNEFFVGRFSCESTTDVTTMVNRTIIYERDLNETDTWLNNGMGVAANEGAGNGHNGGEADYVHMNYIRDTLLNFTYATVQQDYSGGCPGVPNTSSTQLSQHFNDGASIVNYCNHGSQNSWSVGNYSSTHVNALTNVRKWPVIWSVACDNGKFTNGTCFAEAWTRATHNGEPTGAVGTMMSWISQPWTPPMTGQDEMVNLLTENSTAGIKRTLGGTSINGSMKMLDLHGGSGKETHDTWLLFGDPSLMMRTDIPTQIVATYLPAMLVGMDQLQVNADAEGATVALTMDGEILGTAYVESGVANVTFPALTNVGTVTICIQGFNRITHLGEINVVPAEGPFLTLSSTIINDELGNQNGVIDYGESINLGMIIKNVGVEDAENITVTISTESPYINIIQPTATLEIVNAEDEETIENAFVFEVNPNVPYKSTAMFNVLIESDSDVWETTANFYIHAPELILGNNISGTKNGLLNPGETVQLSTQLKNIGDSEIRDVVLNISSPNEEILIDSPIVQVQQLDGGATTNVNFSVTIDENAVIGSSVVIYISVVGMETEFYATDNTFDIFIGDFTPYNMSNTTIETCAAYFYDAGGPIGNYANNSNITTTFLPATEGAAIKVTFLDFSTEANYDFLYIYNGSSASAPQIGRYSGTTSPGTIIASNDEGALTFRFTSDYYGDAPGWKAEVTCFNVGDLNVETTSAFNEVCSGMSTILFANTEGGSGSYTYSWSPAESLDNPNSRNPIATPNETTTYTVTVNDGSSTETSEITINVIEENQTINLGVQHYIYKENESSVTLDATSENAYAYLWSNGETTPTITVSAADLEVGTYEYSVMAFEINGCVARGETIVVVELLVGIEEKATNEVILYPNPSNGNIHIELGDDFVNGAQIIIYNLVGKVVANSKVNSKSCDLSLSHLNNGVYVVTIQNDNNRAVQRMIIQK